MIYSVIVCVIFFAALAMWLVRFVREAGFKLPDNRIVSFLTADKKIISPIEQTTRQELLKIFLFALAFRIIIFLLGWLAAGIFAQGKALNLIDYCNNWNLWDAPHYIEIAQKGYAGHIEDGKYLFLVFFPLYPLLIKIFHFIIPNYAISALTVSFLCYGVGCSLMYKLVAMDYSKAIAQKSVVLLSVYPFAFYFGGIMTESLFFMLIIATFLAIRKHNWLLAGIMGMFAALSRSFGVLMVIPAAIEWITENAPITMIIKKEWKQLGCKILRFLPIIIIPIGTLIYLYINYKVTGDAFVFVKYQSEHWHMNLQFFGKTLNMLWEQTMQFSNWSLISCLYMPELLALPVFALIILYAVRRERSMYVVFMFIYFTFNAAASWPLSLSRYLSCMFPVFWVLADWTERHKQYELPLTALMAIGMGIYLTGYITMHQIM